MRPCSDAAEHSAAASRLHRAVIRGKGFHALLVSICNQPRAGSLAGTYLYEIDGDRTPLPPCRWAIHVLILRRHYGTGQTVTTSLRWFSR